MDNRDKILEFVKVKGPVLPIQISKLISMDMVMASAHLAELTASQKLKISNIKVGGGSPLYYLSGQESMLLKYTSNLNDKELKALELLKESKVLRDSEQAPVIRVALREIKDFAMPLNVKYNNTSEIFWKWFLISDDEAGKLIKPKLEITDKEETKVKQPQPEVQKEFQQKQVETRQKEFPVEKKIEEKPIEKVQQQLKESPEKPVLKARGRKPKETKDNFMEDILKFFEKNKINIVNTEIIKKNSEIDFTIEIPSVMGSLQYYCKAKNKQRINDADLSNAYVKGQFKKLPVIVLAPGELSTKATEMMKKELNNLTFKQI